MAKYRLRNGAIPKKAWRLAAASWILCLAGCLHTYVIPEAAEDGPFARLTHSAQPGEFATISAEDLPGKLSVHVRAIPAGGKCPAPGTGGAGLAGPPGIIGRGGLRYPSGESTLEIDVPIDHLVLIETWAIRRGWPVTSYCRTEVGFVPRDGIDYSHRFVLGRGECGAEVTDASGRHVPTTDIWSCPQFHEEWPLEPPGSEREAMDEARARDRRSPKRSFHHQILPHSY